MISRYTFAAAHLTLLLPLLIPSITAQVSNAECVDSQEPFMVNGVKANCEIWRGWGLCILRKVNKMCPVTCDACQTCSDIEGTFTIKPGADRECNFIKKSSEKDTYCQMENVIKNCPETCGLCDVGNTPSQAPTASTSGSPTREPSSFTPTNAKCVETQKKIKVHGSVHVGTCATWGSWGTCDWVEEVRKMCPVTCDTCGTCSDMKQKFNFKPGDNRHCNSIKKSSEKDTYCQMENVIKICPETCGLCDVGNTPSQAPTDSTSGSPTGEPSSFTPTKTPSQDVASTVEPSIVPTAMPECNFDDKKTCLKEGCAWIGSPKKGTCNLCEAIAFKKPCDASKNCEWDRKTSVCLEAASEAECEDFVFKRPCDAAEGCKWNKKVQMCLEEGESEDNKCEGFAFKKPCDAAEGCEWNKKVRMCLEERGSEDNKCADFVSKKPCNAAESCEWDKKSKSCTDLFE